MSLVAAAVGAAVSPSLAAYTRFHDPTGGTIITFGFPAVLPMKASHYRPDGRV